MRIVITHNMTLDGRIEMLDDWFDPADQDPELAHALIAAALVDEFRVFTYPAWQGRGRSFFPDGFTAPRLRRIDGRVFFGGVMYAAYEPAGLGPAEGTADTACRV